MWATDHGADVALMAFSNPGYSDALQDAVNYAWNHGVVVVAAAGNDGATTPNYPAGDEKVVGVGATNQNDELWSGSNSSDAVFITAPGVGITADSVGGGTDSVTGTSASAAVVAGAAAQLVAVDPYASPGTIVGRLARNTDPDGGVGNGRVNLVRSLADSSDGEVVPTGAPGGGPTVGPYVVSAVTVTSITPTSGPTSGGTGVTIVGTGFTPGQAPFSVSFGGASVTGTRVDNTHLTATSPPHAAGAVDVTVTDKTPSSATLTNGFTYVGSTITVAVTGTQTFGGAPSYSYTQSPSTPVVGGTLTGCTTDATASSNVGSTYHVLVGTCTGLTTDANHQIAYSDGGFTVTKATSVTTVTCPASVIYSGSAQTPCSATVTGAGGLSLTPTPSYSNNTNVGTASASYTYGGDTNHTGSADSKNFAITKATITVTVTGTQTFGGAPSYSYTQSPSTPVVGGTLTGCTTDATASSNVGSTYHVLVGTCTGLTTDANHQIPYSDGGFTVTKATSVTTVTCPASVIYSGSAQTPCSATVTGAGGLSLTPTPSYSNNTNVGTASASYTYGGDTNHTGSADSKNFAITKATITVTVTGTQTFGGAPSYSYTQSPSTPVVGGTLTGCTTDATASSNVGSTYHVLVGTCTGLTTDANHQIAYSDGGFTVTKADSLTTVTCPVSRTYTSAAIEPCSVSVTGAGRA